MRTVSVSLEITEAICLRVMLDVDGRPFQRWSLHGHGAQDEQGTLRDLVGPKAAMRQHAMVAIVTLRATRVYIAANNLTSGQWTARSQNTLLARAVARRGTRTLLY